MVRMRDGSETEDVRLGRLVQFDERSRAFPIRTLLAGRLMPRSYTWRIDAPFLLDQGQEGACVGHAVANELQARPAEVYLGENASVANHFANQTLYWGAQNIDPWPGGSYPGASPIYEGTSVLAGIKVAQRLGYFDEYRWSFGLEDLVIGLGRYGPAVLGLTWFSSNYTPDERGYIRPEGYVVGGHAILARAVKIVWREGRGTLDDVDLTRSYVTLRNSWGRWGYRDSGDCFVTLENLAEWLSLDGEACFAVHRTTRPGA